MAERALTANFGANTSGFSEGTAKIKQRLNELNTAFEENKQKIKETNNELKELKKKEKELADQMKDGGTKEQKEQLQELSTQIAQTNARLGQLKTNEQSLKAEISKSTNELKEQKTHVSQLGNEVNNLKNIVSKIAAVYGGKKLWEMLIGSNEEMEQYQTSFEVMLGDAEKATALIEKMRTFAAKTPLSMGNIVSTGSLLMNYGVGEDDLIETMTQLGDLASGNAEKFERVALAYGQMLAKGKVSGEELRQMTEAGVPLQTALAESIGVTGEEFSKMVSAGKVGIEDLNKAIEGLTTGNGKFAGMMSKQAETMQGMLSTLQDSFSEFFRKMGEGAFGEVKDALSEVMGLLEQWENDGTLDKMAREIGSAIKSFVGFLKGAVSTAWQFKEAIVAGVAGLVSFKAAVSIFNVISGVVTSIKSLTDATYRAEKAQAIYNATAAANPYVLIASLAVAAATAIGTFIFATQDSTAELEKLKDLADEFKSTMEGTKSTYQSLKGISDEYDSISSSTATAAEKTEKLKEVQSKLNDICGEGADKIDLLNGKYDEQKTKLENLTNEQLRLLKAQAQAQVLTYQRMSGEAEKYVVANPFEYNPKKNQIDAVIALGNAVENADFNGDASGYGIEVTGSLSEKKQAYADLIAKMEELGYATSEYSDLYSYFAQQLQAYTQYEEQYGYCLDILNGKIEEIITTEEEEGRAAEGTAKAYEEISTAAKDVVESIDKVASAYKEQAANGKLSYNTMMSLIDAGYAACLEFDNETKQVRLNAEAYKELAKAKLQAQIAELDASIAADTVTQEDISSAGASGNIGEAVRLGKKMAEEAAANKGKILQKQALQSIYDNFDDYFTSGITDPVTSTINQRTEAVNNELKAKQKLRDVTIAALDEEIAKRKQLTADNDLQKQIDAVAAELKYSQMDDFSRMQLEKQLADLKQQQADTLWEREITKAKSGISDWYESEAEAASTAQQKIEVSISDVNRLLSSLATGITNVSNQVQNVTNNNSTANVSFNNTGLTQSQIEQIIRDAIADNSQP